MVVQAAKNCQRCSLMFLDSEADHHDPRNFAVAVTESGKARFTRDNKGLLYVFAVMNLLSAAVHTT